MQTARIFVEERSFYLPDTETSQVQAACSLSSLPCRSIRVQPSQMRRIRTLILVCYCLILASRLVAAAPDAESRPSGDATIRAPFGSSEIVITTTTRLAGAIHSITWNGQEFIDSADHGRQLQSAASFDNSPSAVPETFNPTEAGSRQDGAGMRSTSRLLEISASGNVLRTRTQMAFWLAPGQRSAGQLARNLEPISRHILTKEVRIGAAGLPNVLDYTVAFAVPEGEPHAMAQFEALTGYMPPEFSVFHRFVRATGRLEPLDDGPGEQPDPVVFSTPDGRHAMGIIAADPPPPRFANPGYGRFRFASEKVVKWNCVYRLRDGVPPASYRFRLFVPLGTRDDVTAALRKLSAR
jgi:hypothetical protein